MNKPVLLLPFAHPKKTDYCSCMHNVIGFILKPAMIAWGKITSNIASQEPEKKHLQYLQMKKLLLVNSLMTKINGVLP